MADTAHTGSSGDAEPVADGGINDLLGRAEVILVP